MIKPRVLIIDDDYGDSPALQKGLIALIDPSGRCKFSFCSGQINGRNSLPKVMEAVGSGWPSGPSGTSSWALVLLDVQFIQQPGSHEDSRWGFTVLETLQERWPDLPVVMLTSEDQAKKTQANWAKADGFLAKPSALDTGSERAFLVRLYASGLFPDLREGTRLAGSSPAMLRMLREGRRFACDTLGSGRILYGETGTGKTEFARFIHDETRQISGRRGEFRTWSAAGMNEDIAKDALFGHWKGAHSQAPTSAPGEIEKAERGTFLLDEVASLPPRVQALFMESRRRNTDLRRLISRMYTFPTDREGVSAAKASVIPGAILLEDRRIAVDVVMLTASNVNLHHEEVANARGFRRDLLNDLGVPLYLPTLNDRREDIPEIFDQIVQQINGRLGREPKQIHDQVLTDLQSRDWTGKNIVALRQIAEQAVISARDFDEILPRHLPPPLDLPDWAGSRPTRSAAAIPQHRASVGKDPVSITNLPILMEHLEISGDPEALSGVLPKLQEAYARLILRLLGTALRATRDRRGKTSSLAAICKLLGVEKLKGDAQSSAAYDIVLRIVAQGDVKFEMLSAAQCPVLSDDPDVMERVEQALARRRSPKKTAS